MTHSHIPFSTLLAHDEPADFRAVVPPIHQTSLFTFGSFEEMEKAFSGAEPRFVYTRVGNPTTAHFEAKVAALEGGETARAFGSGMAAISSAVLSHVRAGDRIVCVNHVYPDAFKLFTRMLPNFGVEVGFVDGRDSGAVIQALPGATLLYLESPTSLTFELQDLRALTDAAKAEGVVTLLDNSWATPLYQQPLKHGIDFVVHSASKYLSGHSDVVAGIVVGSYEMIDHIDALATPLLGGKLAPLEAWLLVRGLRTLPLRLAHQGANALELAARLETHPLVQRVHHPLLPSHPQHDVARRYLSGPAALFSFEVRASGDEIARFVNALHLFRLGVSWGGHESLVFPAVLGHVQQGEPNSYVQFEVPKNLVRLSVGLEDRDELWADLEQALAMIGTQDVPHPKERGCV